LRPVVRNLINPESFSEMKGRRARTVDTEVKKVT